MVNKLGLRNMKMLRRASQEAEEEEA